MTSRGVRYLLYAALTLLFVLRHDLWLWNDPQLVLGLPVGLTYHLVYCLVAALLMFLLVNGAWPESVDDDETPAR